MECSVYGCQRECMYKGKQLCQKHYFRLMRNGTTDTVQKRNYRSRNSKGYQLLHEPNHPLAQRTGYVYEHRFVYYEQIDKNPASCSLCGSKIDWMTLHIDHKDCDVTNNKPENLRATCIACNVFRGHSETSMGTNILTVDGVSKSAAAWARTDGVKVTGATISRRLKLGMSHYDCVYSKKITHKMSVPSKIPKRTDDNHQQKIKELKRDIH